MNSPLNGPVLGKAGLVVKNDFTFKDKDLKVSKVRNCSPVFFITSHHW